MIYRQKKFKDMKHSSSLSKEAKQRSGKSGLPKEHTASGDPKNMHVAGEGNSVADTDLPERMQVMLSKFLLFTNISVVNHNFDSNKFNLSLISTDN